MKSAQPRSNPASPVPGKSKQSGGPSFAGPQGGYLAKMAATINGSKIVQAQHALSKELNQGPRPSPSSQLARDQEPEFSLSGASRSPIQGKNESGALDVVQPQDAPVQLMKFSRFSRYSIWPYNSDERELLEQERLLDLFLQEMQPYLQGEYGSAIQTIQEQFTDIKAASLQTTQYQPVLSLLKNLYQKLDRISIKIAAEVHHIYGAENPELLDLSLDKEHTPKSGKMLKIITNAISLMPPSAQTDKNKKLLKEAIYPASKSEKQPFKESVLTEQALDFAGQRSNTILKNLWALDATIKSDWDTIKEKFNLTGNFKLAHLTGSDFHNLGQQVAIIESTTGGKVVYKPRSISPDATLVGTGTGIFHQLNTLSEGEVNLPTMGFHQKTDKKGHDYSYVEFQQQAREMSTEQITAYYRKYGQVVVATRLLGVEDLHHENIMATLGGPTILDAETSFLPYVLEAESFAETGITGALEQHTDQGELANTAFYSQQEKLAWDQMNPVGKQQYENSFAKYVGAMRKQDLRGQRNYLVPFTEGIAAMLGLVESKKAEIIELMIARIQKVQHIRYVPFDTKTFTGQIRNYHDYLGSGQSEKADNVIRIMATQLKEAVKANKFSISSEAWIGEHSLVMRGLVKDFSTYDTPIFYFEPALNHLTYQGGMIAMSHQWFAYQKTIAKVVDNVSKKKVTDVLADLGLQ